MAWKLDIVSRGELVGSYDGVNIDGRVDVRVEETRRYSGGTPDLSRVASLLYAATDEQGVLIDRIGIFGNEVNGGVDFTDEGLICLRGIWVQSAEQGPYELMIGTMDESGVPQKVGSHRSNHEAVQREWRLAAMPAKIESPLSSIDAADTPERPLQTC